MKRGKISILAEELKWSGFCLFVFVCVCVCVFLHYQLEKAVLSIPLHDLKICDSRFSAVMHTTAIYVTKKIII